MKNKAARPTPARSQDSYPPDACPIDLSYVRSRLDGGLPIRQPAHSHALSPAISHIRYPVFSLDAHPHTARPPRHHFHAHHPPLPPSVCSPEICPFDRRRLRPSARNPIVCKPICPPACQSAHSPVRLAAHLPSRPRVRECASPLVHPIVRLFRPSISASFTFTPTYNQTAIL